MNSKELDIVSRALSVIEESDSAEEHAELIGELRTLVTDINRLVYDELQKRGMCVLFEYPGVIHFPNSDGTGYFTSNCNDTWTIDLQATDGSIVGTLNTTLPDTSTDPIRIATTIIETIGNGGLRPWTVKAIYERAKAEILSDMREGKVPSTVRKFATLHDHVDANVYGGLCDIDCPLDGTRGTDRLINALQDDLDEWLKGGCR